MIVDDLAARVDAGPARIVTFDLERLPGRFTRDIWEPRDLARLNYLHPDRWDELPSTLCASWKWHDERRVRFAAAWDRPDDPYHVARVMHDVLSDASVAVTFNGAKADLKWLASDWIVAGLPRPTPYKHVDLYAIARREFAFESKSLRHLCDRLGLPNKSGHYDAAEARAAAAGDEKARARLRRYNCQDSRVTEAVFDRMRPWITGLNLGVFIVSDDDARCPNCGGVNMRRDGWFAAAVQSYALFRCDDCGSLARSNIVKNKTRLRGVK